MNEERAVILKYEKAIPLELKTLINRAITIAFDGCEVHWLGSKTIKLTKIGLKQIEFRE